MSNNKMLIDATHPEETRVVVLRGNRVEEFDFESANRKQLRGNIYLAKVTRVEPSLQAAFVDYGGNRHGFLAFSEIHPDYYQIPVADRQALIDEEERYQRAADAEADNRAGRRRHRQRGAGRRRDAVRSEPVAGEESASEATEIHADEAATGEMPPEQNADAAATMPEATPAPNEFSSEEQAPEPSEASAGDTAAYAEPAGESHDAGGAEASSPASDTAAPAHEDTTNGNGGEDHGEDEHVESVGGADALEEAQERTTRVRPRQYKIQEVIKRRQVMLVQVVKEERGTKGAALTTYLSLAGRYSVLMPNTARGGGISRKITSSEDRSRLKEIAQELEVPEGMGVILRTAGASRTKTEVKRDFEYLLRLWETVRDLTLKSTAPKLTYEEGSLTKRSIRDLYNKDIDEIFVAGDGGYKDAKEFMRMLMPSHAKNVKLYKDSQPIFTRFGIESQLDAMFSPVVQLRSGGYIVINQAEALVAIDVNSGRATREHHIEDTATKTNMEAADEVARQLRLRDLAGLIVIDFIDMDEGRNNRAVERRLKEALKHDRARIQVGRISHFGLMEMSRQRIRTSVLESSTEKCPMCGGTGHVRSVSSVSLQLLRAIEEMLIKGATHNLIVRTRSEVALYVLNHKRAHLRGLEERFRLVLTISADNSIAGQQSYVIDRGDQVHTPEAAKQIAASQVNISTSTIEEEDEDDIVDAEMEEEVSAEPAQANEPEQQDRQDAGDGEREGGRGQRRRRRGRGRGGEGREGGRFAGTPVANANAAQGKLPGDGAVLDNENGDAPDQEGFTPQMPRHAEQPGAANGGTNGGETRDGVRRRRRRGRRGGRRNRNRNGDAPIQGNERPPAESGWQGADSSFEQPAPHESASYEAPPRVETPPPTSLPAESETPRRGSTIREPAPMSFSGGAIPPSAPVPPPAPVVSSTASDNGGQPKRGWWGKRLLGDKG